MANSKFTTGCFEGRVAGEYEVLDVDFAQLEDDLQVNIRDWAESQVGVQYVIINGGCDFACMGGSNPPITINQIKEDFEDSWDSVNTDEEIDLRPMSEQDVFV